MAAHMNFTPAAQVRSTSILSPDRRGGRLTGPGLPVVGTSAWVSAAPSPGLARPVSPPAVSYEPAPVARDGHHSPPPFAQQLQGPLAQQAYMALGQGAEVPATARPQWRDPSGRAAQAPTPQRSAVSAQSLHAPATGSGPLGLGMSPTGARGCSAVVSLGGRPSVPSAPEDGATARFSAPPCQLALGSQGSVQPARVTIECRRQHSVGGLSGASLPSGSPCTATREPKASIEVPCMVASRTEHDSENVKQVVRDAIRGVDDKVTDTNDKVTDTNDKVTDIHAILKSQRGEAQQARGEAQQARGAAQAAQAEAQQARQEAQQAREAERQAREEEQLARVAALEAQAQLEEAQRRARQLEERLCQREEAQRRLEEQLRQAEAARAEGERAGLAQAQQQEQEQQAERQRGRQQAEQQAEALQARLRAAEEEAGQLRVRQRALEAQIDERTSENCELRKQAEQLQGRLAAEGAARAQERQAAEDLGAARRQAEAEVRQAREQVEAELRAPRERLAERERAVEERQRALAAQEARAAQREEALAAQALELEERGAAEGQGAQLELQQLRERSQELERQVQQGRGHKQVVQEQKQTLWSVQSLLHREQSLANFLTPGELQRMMRREGAELAGGPEASELVLRHQGLETEVRELRWHNELLRKNLPRSTWESIARELTRVLPPSEPDAEPSA